MDIDFVRYVAQQANIARQLNTKFLESIQPFVQQAVQQAISDTVVKGLSAPTIITAKPVEHVTQQLEAQAPATEVDFIVNPDNAKIITTKDEQDLMRIVSELFPEIDLEGRDTESYYSILYQNKTNRWLFRYDVNRKRPTIQFNISIDDSRRSELERAGLEIQNNGQIFIEKPEHIYRMVGVLKDSLEYCMNDDNFKRTSA